MSPDGTYAYVSNQSAGMLSVLDLATNTVSTTIPMGANPTTVKFSADGTRAYVTNEFSNAVYVVDTATKVSGTIAVGTTPIDIVLSPDGRTAYVTNFTGFSAQDINPGAVSVIDLDTNTVVDTIEVGDGPVGATLSPDGTKVYVVNSGGSLSVIDVVPNATPVNHAPQVDEPDVGDPAAGTGLVSGSLTATDDDGDTLSYNVTGGPGHGNVGIDSTTGTFVYTPTQAARLAAGQLPNEDTDQFTVTVSDGTANVDKVVTVTIAPTLLSIGATATVGSNPSGVAVSGGKAYVVNSAGNTVSVVDTTTNAVRHHRCRRCALGARAVPRRQPGVRHEQERGHRIGDQHRHQHRGEHRQGRHPTPRCHGQCRRHPRVGRQFRSARSPRSTQRPTR